MGSCRRTPGKLQAQIVRIFRPGTGIDLPPLCGSEVLGCREKARRIRERTPKIGKIDYQAQGVLYIPEKARFATLLNLPEGTDIGRAIDDAMKAIESENEDLKDVLPKTYNALDKSLNRVFDASLAPETCLESPVFANLIQDSVRQAKAEKSLVLHVRTKAWPRYWRSLAWWQDLSVTVL